MALVADEGLALFCGLNAMPKRSFLSEYSSRITPHKVAHLLALWHAPCQRQAEYPCGRFTASLRGVGPAPPRVGHLVERQQIVAVTNHLGELGPAGLR
jgi:hypothetical protein